MHESTVEKGALRQAEIGGRVPVIQALDVRPVLLSCGRLYFWQSGQFHFALEHLREYVVDVGLLTIDVGAVREGDADRRSLRADPWNFSQPGTAVEQLRPLPRVLSACNLP